MAELYLKFFCETVYRGQHAGVSRDGLDGDHCDQAALYGLDRRRIRPAALRGNIVFRRNDLLFMEKDPVSSCDLAHFRTRRQRLHVFLRTFLRGKGAVCIINGENQASFTGAWFFYA